MIRVLPLDQAGPEPPRWQGGDGADPLAWATDRRFTPSGRLGLDAVLSSLELEPDDEVWITNSSGQRYISPCVTCVVFNHCQPSRVLTDRTRAIVVIHEYGYPHPELLGLRAVATGRGIPLIEDCVHSLDSAVDGVPLGSFGDHAIFSLSKVLPVPAGGILVSSEPIARACARARGRRRAGSGSLRRAPPRACRVCPPAQAQLRRGPRALPRPAVAARARARGNAVLRRPADPRSARDQAPVLCGRMGQHAAE